MVRKPSPEKREQFLDAALKLFAEQGVQNSSTAAIAREAGAAAGTLFLYFPTKQELIDELVMRISRQQAEYIHGLLQPSYTAQETFAAIWHGSLRWFLEHEQAYRYNQQVRDSTLVSPWVAQESGKHLAYFFAAIQKGLAEGSIKPYPLDLIGSLIYQDIVAVMNVVRTHSDPAEQEQIMRQGFEIFWNGIKCESTI